MHLRTVPWEPNPLLHDPRPRDRRSEHPLYIKSITRPGHKCLRRPHKPALKNNRIDESCGKSRLHVQNASP